LDDNIRMGVKDYDVKVRTKFVWFKAWSSLERF